MSSEPASIEPPAPARAADPLLQLQEIDLSIDRLRARIEHVESGIDVERARTELGVAEARLSELRLEADRIEREQRRIEGDVDSMQRKISAEERRLYDGSVANSKELQSIRAEVDNLKARKSRMEDELLDLMEQREALAGRLTPVEGEVAEWRDRVAELEETSARELTEAERALGERTAERELAARTIDQEVLELYDEIRRQKRGVGAAALVDGVCQGCRQKLSAVYLDRLKRADGVRRCEYCRRILVID